MYVVRRTPIVMTVLALAAGAVLTLTGATNRAMGWSVVEAHGFRVEIPISDSASLPASTTDTVDNTPALRFGRVIDAGTFRTREYLLYARPGATTSTLMMTLADGCAGAVPATIVTIGDREAVRYGLGGAKGCALGHAFTVGARTYFLTKIPAIGEPLPEPDEEIARIISSVQNVDQ